MDEYLKRSYDSPSTIGAMEASSRMPTIKERLEVAARRAEDQNTKIQRIKEIFEKNPEFEELLNLMHSVNF